MTSTPWTPSTANNVVLNPSGYVKGNIQGQSRVLYRSHNLYRSHIPYDGFIYLKYPASTGYTPGGMKSTAWTPS